MKRASSSVPKSTAKKRSETIQPIPVDSMRWLIIPVSVFVCLFVQATVFRATRESVWVHLIPWGFMIFSWFTRPNGPDDERVQHSIDWRTMFVVVQLWFALGPLLETIVLWSFFARMYGLLIFGFVWASFFDAYVPKNVGHLNILMAGITFITILIPAHDALPNACSPFNMYWRLCFYCVAFILADARTKIGPAAHLHGRRTEQASKIRDFQTMWILFVWKWPMFLGSVTEVGYLTWGAWALISELRTRTEDDENNQV